jgi:DNA-3-methyladenine glycosylase I
MCEYHDKEYGRKKDVDAELFEKLCLEGFQAGLSWRTVLYKRESFRRCFYGFDIEKVAAMTEEDVDRLLSDSGIVRNRRKIEAAINNAELHTKYFSEEGSFKRYVYAHDNGEALSKDLKKKGYRFVGAMICESFLLSVGAMEAHEKRCFLHNKL